MSVFLQNTSLTGINKAALQVLLANELGNKDGNAFQLFYAGRGVDILLGWRN